MTRQISDEVNRPIEGLALWWLGNAGFAIRYGGLLMFIDPVIEFWSEEQRNISEVGLRLLYELPLRAKEVKRVDIVMLTHNHGDHAAPKTLAALKMKDCKFFLCPDSCIPVLDQVGVERSKVGKESFGQGITYEGVSIEPIWALHGGRHGLVDHNLEKGAGYVIRAGGHSIFHPGDTVLLEEHYELKNIEILLLPICNHSRSLIDLAEILAPKYVIAMHYGTYEVNNQNSFWTYGNPEGVIGRMKYPERLIVLEQGEIFRPH